MMKWMLAAGAAALAITAPSAADRGGGKGWRARACRPCPEGRPRRRRTEGQRPARRRQRPRQATRQASQRRGERRPDRSPGRPIAAAIGQADSRGQWPRPRRSRARRIARKVDDRGGDRVVRPVRVDRSGRGRTCRDRSQSERSVDASIVRDIDRAIVRVRDIDRDDFVRAPARLLGPAAARRDWPRSVACMPPGQAAKLVGSR